MKRRRIEVIKTVIAPGAVVRVKKDATNRLSTLMARWEVLEVDEESEQVTVQDIEDPKDVRKFGLDELERISGGEERVVGFEYVSEPDFGDVDGPPELLETLDEDELDDGEDDIPGYEAELGSLFDDPVRLQMEEDEEDDE